MPETFNDHGEILNYGETLKYLTDDCDVNRNELTIFQGGNGDWYVAIVKEDEALGPCVRITTSCNRVPGLAPAIANAYRALWHNKTKTPSSEPQVSVDALLEERDELQQKIVQLRDRLRRYRDLPSSQYQRFEMERLGCDLACDELMERLDRPSWQLESDQKTAWTQKA